MIEIIIPPMSDEPSLERLKKIPEPLLNAVVYMTNTYQERNDTKEMLFDRKFEELHPSTEVLYNPDRVVWKDDKEYTIFCLRYV
jgi:hypothetical protein